MIFIIFLLGCGVLILIYMLREAFFNQVCYHSLYFSDLPTSFSEKKIFFISDIHRRTISKRIIKEVAGKAEMVIIGGDLAEKKVPLQRIKENLVELKKIGPVYFVWGNNDYEVDNELLTNLFNDLGIHVLLNKVVHWESSEGDLFHLIGIDDYVEGNVQLESVVRQTKKHGFRLLVSHNPEIIRDILPEHEIHLVLSGHTHGGQIRIFGFGPYEKGGIKKIGKTTVFVSNGYGTTAVPFRLGARAETHLISIIARKT